ncbi:MAG: PQQ-binding-like beta-propeller repeat protein [Phycisphaerales bacterium]|nr:PQQ-binding-like beta-propeller repeat protein [Phycisphaerales bacterium]
MYVRNANACIAALCAALVTASATYAADPPADAWPSFRGRGASGIAAGPTPPAQWDLASGRNVLWKTPIPGLGHASPIVWADHVYVLTAISGKADAELRVGLYGDIASVQDDSEHRWVLSCHDARTGESVWQREVYKGVPKVKRHTKSTHANATPATNGKYVVVMLGSEGLHCYTTDGEHVWSKDFGVLDSGYYMVPGAQWGFGSSPVIDGDRVIVQCDVQKDSFIAAYALADGKELWRTARDEVPTWSTPTVHHSADRDQVVVNGIKHIAGYDLASGKELWHMKGAGDIPVPTPVVANGLAYIANAHGFAAPLFAVKLDATGDISLTGEQRSNAGVAWCNMRNGAYMQTPLVVGDLLYSCRDNGVLTCYEAATGAQVYRNRLGGGQTGFTASPVAAGDHIYFTSEDGDVYVIQAGREYQELAHNTLGEVCMATPAIVNGVLYFRTQSHLIAVAHQD